MTVEVEGARSPRLRPAHPQGLQALVTEWLKAASSLADLEVEPRRCHGAARGEIHFPPNSSARLLAFTDWNQTWSTRLYCQDCPVASAICAHHAPIASSFAAVPQFGLNLQLSLYTGPFMASGHRVEASEP